LTTGELIAQGSIIVGVVAHHVLHVSSGAIVGPGAEIVGVVSGSGISAAMQNKLFRLRRGR
jgi:hypothetical protein